MLVSLYSTAYKCWPHYTAQQINAGITIQHSRYRSPEVSPTPFLWNPFFQRIRSMCMYNAYTWYQDLYTKVLHFIESCFIRSQPQLDSRQATKLCSWSAVNHQEQEWGGGLKKWSIKQVNHQAEVGGLTTLQPKPPPLSSNLAHKLWMNHLS